MLKASVYRRCRLAVEPVLHVLGELLHCTHLGSWSSLWSPLHLQNMRLFYLTYPPDEICQTASGKSDGDSIEVRLRVWMTPPRKGKTGRVRIVAAGVRISTLLIGRRPSPPHARQIASLYTLTRGPVLRTHFNLPAVRLGDIPATPRCRSVLTGLSIDFIIEV